MINSFNVCACPFYSFDDNRLLSILRWFVYVYLSLYKSNVYLDYLNMTFVICVQYRLDVTRHLLLLGCPAALYALNDIREQYFSLIGEDLGESLEDVGTNCEVIDDVCQ
jgi:hypothetical protein